MEDYKKRDVINLAKSIIEPILKFKTIRGINLESNVYTHYDDSVRDIEAFSRILYGMVPIIINECNNEYLELIKNIILEGTDVKSDNYWGVIKESDQRQVETVPILLALFLTKVDLFDKLSYEEQKQISNWFLQVNNLNIPKNNWIFFRILVNFLLRKLGMEYDEKSIYKGFEIVDQMYIGNGWYSDGANGNIDLYNPFAIHFYSLLYAKYSDDEERSRIIIERSQLFAKNYIYWFANDGSCIPYGRSLVYRFAQVSFWSAMALNNVHVYGVGVTKGIIFRNLEYWLKKEIFDNGGVLNLGYCYQNQYLTEDYNASCSVLWALKVFVILLINDGDEFWEIAPVEMPKLLPRFVDKYADMTICRSLDEEFVVLFPNRNANCQWNQCDKKYLKFFYSNKFGFNIGRENNGIENYGADSSLLFTEDNQVFYFRNTLNEYKNTGEYQYSKWVSGSIATVKTYVIPQLPSHIRVHKIKIHRSCYMYETGSAIGIMKDTNLAIKQLDEYLSISNGTEYTSIESLYGNGTARVVKSAVNTNIIYPHSYIPALEWKLVPGYYVVVSKISLGSIKEKETEVGVTVFNNIVDIKTETAGVKVNINSYIKPKRNVIYDLRIKTRKMIKFLIK